MVSTVRASVRDRFHKVSESCCKGLELRIESGTLSDYRALERFHYRGGHPGGVTSVLCMRCMRPSAGARFARQAGLLRNYAKIRNKRDCAETRCAETLCAEMGCAEELGAEMWCANGRCAGVRCAKTNCAEMGYAEAHCAVAREHSEVVGVLVRSLPPLACRMRDDATGGRYAKLAPRDAGVMLNREVRTISRVVIDPRYRGLGLAVELVRHALASPEPHDPPLRFTEALAAMGHVSPFFERAGMKRFERPLRSEHLRLVDALQHVGLQPEDQVSLGQVHDRIASQSAAACAWLERELRRWHRAAHRVRKDKLAALSLDALLQIARRELLAQPVYYIHRHSFKRPPG